jgi:hypothetical protein
MPDEYADAPDGAAEFFNAGPPPRTGFADRVPGHLESIRRTKELVDKGDYGAATEILMTVRLDYRQAGVKTPPEYDRVRNATVKAMMEAENRAYVRVQESEKEVQKDVRDRDTLANLGIEVVRSTTLVTQHFLEFIRVIAEKNGKPLPPVYDELKERVDGLERNTGPGAEMLKDPVEAYKYATREQECIEQLLETEFTPFVKQLNDPDDEELF